MGTYLNPAESIKKLARNLEGTSWRELTKQMKPGERLFALAYRSGHPQCLHIKSRELHSEYQEAASHMGYMDSYWAMDHDTFTKEFDWATSDYHTQQGVPPIEESPKEEMTPVEDLFYPETNTKQVAKTFILTKGSRYISFHIYDDDTADIVSGLNNPVTKHLSIEAARHRFGELTVEGGYTWKEL